MFLEHSLNAAKFYRTEAQVARLCGVLQPKLGRLVIAINVHMRWLVRFMAIEVNAVRTGSQNGRHNLSISRYASVEPAAPPSND